MVLNPTGGAELATAGSGDVLSGVIAGFLARGMDRVHCRGRGRRGCTAEPPISSLETHGPGLVAGDLLEAIPRTLYELSHPAPARVPGVRNARHHAG